MDASGLKKGDRISEYILEEKVGAGGFGEVWRARHHIWKDQVVAIKVPLVPDYIKQLKEEGKLQHQIDSPHVAKTIGLDTEADVPYLVMEYVRGRDLRDILNERNRLPQKEAINIVLQVTKALEIAHGKGIAHRDIKPANIMITDQDLVKLTDFGLGQLVEGTSKSLALSGSLVTAEGHDLSGTLRYMSPEQGDPDIEVDTRTDIYSLGIVLFELLTGEYPQGAEVPSDIAPEIDRRLDAVFKHCYARRDKRYKTITDMADDLKAIRKGDGGPLGIEESFAPKSAFEEMPVGASRPKPKEIITIAAKKVMEKTLTRRSVAFIIDAVLLLAVTLVVMYTLGPTETSKEYRKAVEYINDAHRMKRPLTLVEISNRFLKRAARSVQYGLQQTVNDRIYGELHYALVGGFPYFQYIFLLAVFGFIYFWLFTWHNKGRTIGKKMFGIKVISLTGEKIGGFRAALRAAGHGVSVAPAGLGLLAAFLREDNMALHDMISQTMVVRDKDEDEERPAVISATRKSP